MFRGFRRFSLAALASLALVVPSVAEPPPVTHDEGEGYQVALVGTMAGLPGRLRGPATQPVKIWVDRLTTDAEAEALAELVRAEGPRAVERALFDVSIGRLQIGNRLGFPISFARRYEDERGQHLLLVAQRPIAFREVVQVTRSRNYPFTVIELDLDAAGRGSGEVLAAARLRTHDDGEVELLNLEFLTAHLLGVAPLGS